MPDPTFSPQYPTDLDSWQALQAHHGDDIAPLTLKALFAADTNRFDRFSVAAGDLFLDFSKNYLQRKTLDLLLSLAREAGVAEAIRAMFAGEKINVTEGRPVLHVALRAAEEDQVAHDVPGVTEVWQTLAQMREFVAAVQGGDLRGHTGKRLTNIVNIGIGGSNLGGVMASHALRHYWQDGMAYHAVSNVDGTQLADLARQLDPATTLIVICSKTFTTRETMSNAQAARRWIAESLGSAAVERHFAAASTNHAAMNEFGVDPARRFGFHDWVGGRYSIWSAVGLSLALVTGMDAFLDLLAGARRMDQHFRTEDFEHNMPVLLALIALWNRNFMGATSMAVLPYDNRLDRFPAFLQQLQMESNGKGVRSDGSVVSVRTCPIIWGEPGSDAQHSFYQLLHQGTDIVPVDFILPARSSGGEQRYQDMAAADCIAQSEALMDGYSAQAATNDLVAAGTALSEAARLAPHKTHPGGRPSNTLLCRELTPQSLGQLIALYEHKVFVEAVIWGINAFDQFGVELGKRLAAPLGEVLGGKQAYAGANASSAGLLAKIRQFRG